MRLFIHRNLFNGSIQICLLMTLTVSIFLASFLLPSSQPEALAANPGYGHRCSWYTVRPGDTLGGVARHYRSNIWTIARANYIYNVNLIFINQRLCLPISNSGFAGGRSAGLLSNGGAVRWYAYDALEWSNQAQTIRLIRRIAGLHGIPDNLMLAIAWQESNWNQHVISRDGGIGVMQIMPYTATWLNSIAGTRNDPYTLWGNLNLGATYLSWLWRQFRGNWTSIISAYNEGDYAVSHWGIYNWGYVNNVLYLSHRLW
jgi:soluble lytic murein transglycosylase-like protein